MKGSERFVLYSSVRRRFMTSITLDEKEFKTLLKEALTELFQERQDLFLAIVAEALEDIGLANAIREGRKDDFVSRKEIDSLLAG
jgi:hypothetical protein